jgi:mercuric ion binding protein
MKKIIIALSVFLISASAFAETAKVQVNGMVCAFCAQGIKKKFAENPNVESCEVDLDKKIVEVKIKKDKTVSDEEIKKIIKDAGYAAIKLERFK